MESSHKMNGGAAPEVSSTNPAKGSKKRKHGMAPRKATLQLPTLPGEAQFSIKCGQNEVQAEPESNTNGQIAPTISSKEPELNGTCALKTIEALCSVCCKLQTQRTFDLRTNLEMKHTLTNVWNLTLNEVENVLASMCLQCIYKANAQKEATRNSWKRRYNATSTTSTTKTHLPNAKTTVKTTDDVQQATSQLETSLPKDNVDTPTANTSKQSENCTQTIATLTTGNGTAHVHLTNSLDWLAQRVLSPISSVSAHSSQNSMLAITSELSECALVTESGGKINNYKPRKWSKQLVCMFCTRVYLRYDFYKKHIRHCQPRFRHATAVVQTDAASAVAVVEPDVVTTTTIAATTTTETIATATTTTTTTTSPTATTTTTTTKSRQTRYNCSQCAVTVESTSKLRGHQRIHLKHYYCDLCGNGCTTSYEYDHHRVECEAKHEVSLKKLKNFTY